MNEGRRATKLAAIAAMSFMLVGFASHTFLFWPKPGAENDPRVSVIEDGPCGEVATARVATIPLHGKDPALEPERVIERGPNGEVVNRWSTPVDSYPIAIRGKRLLVEAYRKRFWVSTDGSFSVEVRPIQIGESVARECRSDSEFPASDYMTCGDFKDLYDGRLRRLLFEGVCT